MESLRSCVVPTPLGNLVVVASSRGVVETAFAGQDRDDGELIAAMAERLGAPVRPVPRARIGAAGEVRAYFGGRLRSFATPPDLSWLPPGFPRRVLEVTASIPYGELWTYGDVAGMAGSPRAARAAGNALSRCPIELFVPCHRVVHADGSAGGYGRHEDRKRWLIRHERERDVRDCRARG